MTFRDDHEAALARVAALQSELEREKRDDAHREERIAALQQDLAAARIKLERAESELAALKPAEPEPAPRPARKAEPAPEPDVRVPDSPRKPLLSPPQLAALVIGLGLAGVVCAAVVASGKREKPDVHKAPAPSPKPVTADLDDVVSYLAEARARRDRVLPGARLVELRAEGVDERGRLHPEFGVVEFDLHRNNPEPARVEDPDRPIGAPEPEQPYWNRHSCATLRRTAHGWQGDPPLDLPGLDYCVGGDRRAGWTELELRCTTRAIWAMALRDGAPPGAIAKISTTGGRWDFEIDDPRAPFERTYPDDCVSP